jgi:voltage-gated potassium channel
MIVGIFLFAATAPDGAAQRGVLVLLEVATLVLALWTSGLSQNVTLGAAFGVLGVLIAGAALLDRGHVALGALWVVNVALVLAIALAVMTGIADQREVNRQSVTGAICVYVLIGLVFALVYGAAAAFDSGFFFAQGTDGTTSLRLYFSYVTLATLGYGDYTPSGDFGHTAAISEALIGQLYLVTVVALLVSNFGRKRTRTGEE